MNYVAPLISGRYDFTFLPLSLPTPLVLALLSTSLAAQPSPFLPPTELSTLGLSVPSAGEGRSWVIVEAGRQLGTGMAIPGGRSTFAVRPFASSNEGGQLIDWVEQEAKLEIPFLRHPEAAPSMAFTLKQTILVDSLMMKLSSSGLTGLRSAKASFSVKEEDYAVKNWMELKAGSGDARGEGWSEELVRAVVEGWWIGERTGGTAVRVS